MAQTVVTLDYHLCFAVGRELRSPRLLVERQDLERENVSFLWTHVRGELLVTSVSARTKKKKGKQNATKKTLTETKEMKPSWNRHGAGCIVK